MADVWHHHRRLPIIDGARVHARYVFTGGSWERDLQLLLQRLFKYRVDLYSTLLRGL